MIVNDVKVSDKKKIDKTAMQFSWKLNTYKYLPSQNLDVACKKKERTKC